MNTNGRIPSVEEVFEELLLYYSDETGSCIEKLRNNVSLEMSLMTFSNMDSDFDWAGFFDHFLVVCPDKFTEGLSEKSTVYDFCVYLSKKITIPDIHTIQLLGKPCKSAGMFLDIKQKLIDRGEKCSEIAPSSNLRPFLVRHKDLFRFVRWYSPGKIPVLNVRNRIAEWGCLSLILTVTIFGIYGATTAKLAPNMPSLMSYAYTLGSLSLTCMGIGIIFRRHFETASFEGLTDFRSLVDALLDRPPSRPRKTAHARGNN